MRRLLLTALLFPTVALYGGQQVTHRFETSVPLTGIRRVVVEIPAGEIHVRNGVANEIAASGAIRREYDDDDDRAAAQRAIDDVDVEVYTSKDEAIVRRHLGPNAHGWHISKLGSIDLDLTLPPGVDLSFETKAGEIWLEGSFGNLSADLRAGEIHLTTPRANVKELSASCRIGEVHTSFGDRRVDREGILPGTTHFANAEGRTKVDLHTTVGEVHVTLTP